MESSETFYLPAQGRRTAFVPWHEGEGGSMNSVTTAGLAPAAPHLYAPVAGDLLEVERILAESLRSRHPRVAAVVDHVRHYRGKRLRPVLLRRAARACGPIRPAHHILGAVVEMIHTATLLHDDVLDSATVRRHVP